MGMTRKRPRIINSSEASHWDPDDLLALRIARAAYASRSPAFEGDAIVPSHRFINVMTLHGLLALIDPKWPGLPLDERGRGEVATAIRRQSMLSLQRVGTAMKVRDALTGAGIRCLFHKGVALSQVVWGRASARGAGDIDVLVDPREVLDAVAVLKRIGVKVPAVIADLRPRHLDRQMHHALCLQYEGTDIDLHYRLDDIESVMHIPFDVLWQRSQQVSISGQSFTTLNDVDTTLQIAATGGRDAWVKWGLLVDFAVMQDRTPVDDDYVKAAGLGHRFDVARALTEVLEPGRHVDVSAVAHRLARTVVARHARGIRSIIDGSTTDLWELGVWKARSAPSMTSLTWAGRQVFWTGDAPGRQPDAGIGEDVGIAVRRVLRANNRPVMAPPDFLCDLVDGQTRSMLDAQAFTHLDAALRTDSFSAEEYAVLPLLAPLIAEHYPNHPFTARIEGVRRRARLSVAASQSLVSAVQAQACDGVLLGDLAAAQNFYHDPSERQVTDSKWVSPGLTRAEAWQIAENVASQTGAEVLGVWWPTLQRHGVRVALHRSLSTAFDFPGARRLIDTSAELSLYDSLVRSASGAPRIAWYTDAVNVGDRVDWDRLWWVAREAGWVDPVAKAAAVIAVRHRGVPLREGMDSLVDSGYFSRSTPTAVNRTWLALRLARRGGIPSALR